MKRILVIDDNEHLRAGLLEILGYEGFAATEAENGEMGIHSAREQTPDLIICDISMPVLDGFEVIRALRQDTETASIPIIVLSARNDEDFIQLGVQLGAVAYLTKPYDLLELLDLIRTHTDGT